MTVMDLVSLGLGSCSGTGMYVVAGYIAYAVAGPAVIISFLLGGVASIFSGEWIFNHRKINRPCSLW